MKTIKSFVDKISEAIQSITGLNKEEQILLVLGFLLGSMTLEDIMKAVMLFSLAGITVWFFRRQGIAAEGEIPPPIPMTPMELEKEVGIPKGTGSLSSEEEGSESPSPIRPVAGLTGDPREEACLKGRAGAEVHY